VSAAVGTVVPVNDLKRYASRVSGAAAARAAEVIASGHFVLGPWVRRFEQDFATHVGRRHCLGVGNGTDALEIALRAVGIGAGDRVIVAANAAMYGTGAVLAVGAEPVFVDVDPTFGLLDPEKVEDSLASSAACAVILTHLYGRLAPASRVAEACRSHGAALIEDCAQAHGAADEYGTCAGAFGDIATFSFYPTKNLGAIGDGGAIVCEDDALAQRVAQLRQYGWERKYCNVVAHGRNSRLDELQAALLHLFLADLDARNARRREIANRYSAGIRNPRIVVPPAGGAEFVAHLYVVQSTARDALAQHLQAFGIATDVHYPTPDYRQPVHAQRFAQVLLPHTERLCAEVLTLPCFPELDDTEIERVIEACNGWTG